MGKKFFKSRKQMPILQQAHAVSLALFLIGLAALAFFGAWWPGILVVVSICIAVKYGMLEQYQDTLASVIVLGGIFYLVHFKVTGDVFLPMLFALGGAYILFREYFEH